MYTFNKCGRSDMIESSIKMLPVFKPPARDEPLYFKTEPRICRLDCNVY